ncbi:MAG TPA: hypothetical protein VOB72_22930 [Candidatus Dormibacteraeota bacterium]|nr:hypothetical protein [Candidatus Dormibacteraeota bacterium]
MDEQVEFVGSVTEMSYSSRDDDDDSDCPSADGGRSVVACCSPGLD